MERDTFPEQSRPDIPSSTSNQSQNGVHVSFASGNLFKLAPVAILISDCDGKLVEANNAACALLGHERNDLLKLMLGDIAPDDPGLADFVAQRNTDDRSAARRSCRLLAKDGTRITADADIAPIQGEGGSTLAAIYLSRGVAEPSLPDPLSDQGFDYRRFVELTPDSVFLCRQGTIEFANAAAARLMGVGTPEPLVGRNFPALLHADYQPMASENFACLVDEEEPTPVKVLRDDGTNRDVMLFAGLAPDETDLVIVIVRDITDMMSASRDVAAQVRRLNSILDTAHEAIVVMDRHGRIETFNRSAETMFGCSATKAVGVDFGSLMADRDTKHFHNQLASQGTTAHRREIGGNVITARRLDGSEFPAEYSLSSFNIDERRLFTAVIRDITERKLFEDHLAHSATHDALTGLPNRRFVEEELERILKAATATGEQVSVWFIDLDGFTTVNDVLGHAAGDELLIAAGKRLSDLAGPGRCVARFSGDEFIVIMAGRFTCTDIKRAVGPILEQMVKPFSIRGRDISVQANVGIAIYPDHSSTASDLVTHASAAMMEAKSGGRNRFRVFDPAVYARSVERLALENDLRRAIENEEFVLHYQPQLDIKTGGMLGMEALIRWNHPTLGLLLPGRFISLAEQTGLILPIGEWVLRQACQDLRAIADIAPSVSIAVNISPRQFSGNDIRGIVRHILAETGADPRRLELEITESTLMNDPDHVSVLLDDLKTLGIRLAVDDFGTGYSSLGYLKRFPVDTLKMDRAFVRDIADNPQDEAIAITIVTLAHAMGMTAVGEGVETAAQHKVLAKLNCDVVQGFHYSRPKPLSVLFPMLTSVG